jgi:hypothetical protein
MAMSSIPRSALAALLLLSVGPAVAQDPAPAPAKVCLQLREVQRTETPDDRTILFHMRDGKIWRNTLRQNCPMLRTSPWAQVLPNGEMVCSNQQFIHVLQTGNTCTLGEFTPMASSR